MGKQAGICTTAACRNQQCLELYVHVAKERALRSLLSKEGQSQDFRYFQLPTPGHPPGTELCSRTRLLSPLQG